MAGLAGLIASLVTLYEVLIIVRVIFTWVSQDPYNPIIRFLGPITDPLLDATRNAFPFLAQGGIDFSPIVILVLLDFTKSFIMRLG
ncbi:MAG: YggT family protein [bacterium]|nr:YggT family protein [bacterium]